MAVKDKAYLRFRWSHDLRIHRLAVRLANKALSWVPFSIKYGIGKRLREGNAPYNLIHEGSIVVQVGAPLDTLLAGRSRGMYFCLLAGESGKVIIVEPDEASIEQFSTIAQVQRIKNVIYCKNAAWSDKRKLNIFINDAHPASSFTDGTKNYDSTRLKDFRSVELEVEPMDDILKSQGVKKVDLVSITTNGAEKEILKGMRGLIAAGLPYISLARTGNKYIEMMDSLGYQFYSHDDRGYTFIQGKNTKKETI